MPCESSNCSMAPARYRTSIKIGNRVYASSCVYRMIGTVNIAMNINMPANQPFLPNYFLSVSVKSKSVPAAFMTKYCVVNEMANATNVKNNPRISPD